MVAGFREGVVTTTQKSGYTEKLMLNWIGRILCRFGFHDYRLIEAIGAFGVAGQVQKVECRRCGYVTTRSG